MTATLRRGRTHPRTLDVEETWDAATEVERRVLIDEVHPGPRTPLPSAGWAHSPPIGPRMVGFSGPLLGLGSLMTS